MGRSTRPLIEFDDPIADHDGSALRTTSSRLVAGWADGVDPASGAPGRVGPAQPTGVWWAAAAVVLATLARTTFGWAGDSLGVAVTVWNEAVVGWLAGLPLPGLTRLMEAIVASTGSAA